MTKNPETFSLAVWSALSLVGEVLWVVAETQELTQTLAEFRQSQPQATTWGSSCAATLLPLAQPLHADIYRWDNGQLIAGTEGIEPGPGVQLDHRALEYARLGGWNPGEAIDLTGANAEESNLTNANLQNSTLMNANLTGANLRNAFLVDAAGLPSTTFDASTVYNQWTVFSWDFDPAAAGLTLVPSPAGDLDTDDAFDADDVDMLASRIGRRDSRAWWLPDAAFDMNGDGSVSADDHRIYIKELAHTWYGDADLDGEFNSVHFVQVFQAGKYEGGAVSGWSEGDWNGDGLFNSADFITAFQDGGYEQGPRTDVAAVPEPAAWTLLVIGFVLWLFSRRTCAI